MQYQIQQIRQHFTSIDNKFRRMPAFVIKRQLFTCRSQSPSFYKLRSQTVYNPLNMSCSPARQSLTFGSPTPPISNEKQPLKLTRVHDTHEKIMSQSQERFYQRRISEKNEKSQQQKSQKKEQTSQVELISTTPFNKLNMAKVNEYKQSSGSNRYAESKNQYADRPEESVPESNEVKETLELYKKEDDQDQNIELQNSQQPVDDQQQQGTAFTLHACDQNNSYKAIMSRKSGNKNSTKKSPTKTPKSPKKQHIIYYNQIYLCKPRQQQRLSSSKQSYYSNRQISPRKQSKLQSCILTTPSKRYTCPPLQPPEEEIEVINLAPEFSKFI